MSDKRTNPESSLDKQDAAQVKNYTRTPNMLIFGYQDTLSPQEKWLYVCLKHMCGKKGTRHLSLRYIAEKTGISVGALSKSKSKQGVVNEGMIKHLHDAELIHAEIKKHDGKGNAQYHITITDVWTLNQAFFDTTCPNSEQVDDEENEPVQNSDEPVRISDKLVQNSDEPVRNPVQYQDYIQDSNKREKQEESVSAPPTSETPAREDTHTSFSNSSSSQEQVAETIAPTQQARSSADSATSDSDAPRTPTSPSVSPTGVRGVFPSDHNRGLEPPLPDKSQVNGQAYPWMTMLDQWDKDYNGGRRSKRDNLTLRHAREWMVEMNLTYQDAQTVRRKIIEHNLHRGKPITFTMVYDHSEWLGEIPEASVHQNGQGKHATSTPLDTERNERNLQNLLKRAAEKRAAQATTE